MFTRKRKMVWQILWIGTVFFFIGYLFAIPCSAQKVPKGKAVIGSFEPFNMTGGDPHTSPGAGGIPIGNLIHEGLVRKDHDGRMAPALAKSWEASKDGLSMKFTLNERAKFHNGEPVTANDVKFSIERAMRPELKFARGGSLRTHIDRIEVMDDHHLTVYFKSPYLSFLEWSTEDLRIVPKAYVEKVGDVEFSKHPIGAGPFRWIDYQQEVFVKAEAVEDHYRKVPAVKTVEIKFHVDPATLIAMFKSGEAEVIQLPVANILEIKNDPRFKVVWSNFVYASSLVFCDLAFPNDPSPFHDIRVRRAVSYAINRKVICENVLHGSAETWGDLLAPYHPGADPDIKLPYDPEKAKALLKEAGYPNGFDTTLTCGFMGDRLQAQAVAADLARVGIRAKLVELEHATWQRSYFEKKFRGLTRHTNPWWGGRTHPGVATEVGISSKIAWTYFTTPQTEAAWQKLAVLSDEKAITAQAKELSRLWRESEVRCMLWAMHQPFALSPKVKSYKPIMGWSLVSGLEYLELND